MIDPASIDPTSGHSPELFSTELRNIKMSDHDLNDAPAIIDVIDDVETSTVSHSSTSAEVDESAMRLSPPAEADVPDVIARGTTALTVVEPISYEEISPVPEDSLPGYTDYTADGRPIIYVDGGTLSPNMRDAERYLAGTGRHFHRGRSIVEVCFDPSTKEAAVEALSTPGLVYALDEVSAWMKHDKRGNTWSQIDPPEHICKIMTAVARHNDLPAIKGIARQPFLRPDGSLCQTVGHDHFTGLFGVFDAEEFDVPVEPTREQAEQSLALLDDLLREFEFTSPQDRSAALSAIITAAIRPSLAQAPMFHVRAPQIASGKSYLCQLITALASPRKGAPFSFPKSDTECGKVLLSRLKHSPAVIEFDNLTGDLMPYDSLCTVLTTEEWTSRILGKSKDMTVGTRTLFLSSGNNVGPVADMTRRCLTIRLNPECEVPAARAFTRPNLAADVLRQRSVYVSAALTAIRAWIVAGRPTSACSQLPGYGDWTELCCQPLLWLGQPDPVASTFEAMADDPDRQALGLLLSCWYEQFGGDPLLVRELLNRAAALRLGSDCLNEVLLDIAGDRDKVNSKKLGQWIKRHAGQLVDGLRLVKVPVKRNSSTWRVESVVSIVSVAATPSTEIGVATEPLAATPF